MIYLIVGQPRSGKTQYAVKVAFDINEKNKAILEKIEQGKELKQDEVVRKIYSDIDEFALRNDFVIEAPKDWREVEDGSVIFYDEVHFRDEYLDQNKYMSQDPMIKDLSIHGHRNIDIYLITQDPRRLEKSIRALIFKMYLVKRPANLPPFANIYTFDRWLGDPWAASKNPDNVHDTWKFIYKKKYYEAYKSASAHTSISFKLQNKFIWALVAIVLMIALATYLFKISGMGKLVTDATNVSKIKQDTAVDPDKIMKKNLADEQLSKDQSEYNQNKVVIYDANKPYEFNQSQYQYQVTDVPVISGCMQYGSTCNCYTQQATRLEVTQADCKRYLAGDRPFNPFHQPVQQQLRQEQQLNEVRYVDNSQQYANQFDTQYAAKMAQLRDGV